MSPSALTTGRRRCASPRSSAAPHPAPRGTSRQTRLRRRGDRTPASRPRWRAADPSSFFFSSRRRHTRFDCEWSSDVCSSDLGIETDVFHQISTAWLALQDIDYGVIVIDRGLPDGDGLQLVQRLRAAGRSTPCLMLTARDALSDRVGGLEAGADDYLTKPFPMEELIEIGRASGRE